MNDKMLKHPDVAKSIQFVKIAFRNNPHFSFDDWHIMFDHSVQTMHHALKLAENRDVDYLVVALAALFHDIGKTIKADEMTLLRKHEEMGADVVKEFLKTLDLNKKQVRHVLELFKLNNSSLEKQLVKDADYMDFYMNERLHDAFKKWADRTKIPGEMERKLNRFEKMSPRAKQLSIPYFENLKKKWGLTT